MGRSEFLSFFCSSSAAVSSILAAVVAFMISARNSLRGSGLDRLEALYGKVILALIIVFAVSVVSFLYFAIVFLWSERGLVVCGFDVVFIIAMLGVLPAMVVIWIWVYFNDR